MIQSLSRGLEILDLMANRGGETSVTEAARFLGVDRSTSSRLMATLESRGYLDQDVETHRFRLGTKLIHLSNILLQSLNLGTIGHEEVRALVEQTGEGAQLAILGGTSAVFIDHADGRERLTINTNVGDHDPLHCTAIGRALLSGLSDAEVRDLLTRTDLERYTPRTVVSISEIVDRLGIVRRQGYAFDDEERYAGVQCVAAPVYDHTARVVAAIGISGPTPRMIRATERALAEAVRAASRQLSSRLGYFGPAGSSGPSAVA
jgi:IclR family transcriptional regulator, KDG regulon repressor